MDNRIPTPTGPLTLDHSMTVGYILSRGITRIHYSQIRLSRSNGALPTRPVPREQGGSFLGRA